MKYISTVLKIQANENDKDSFIKQLMNDEKFDFICHTTINKNQNIHTMLFNYLNDNRYEAMNDIWDIMKNFPNIKYLNHLFKTKQKEEA